MNAVLDNLLVAAVLLASIGYAVVKLGPRILRKRILSALGLAAASGKAQAACGGCDNCGTESTSLPQSSSEINVPVSKISRRA
jgi:hypothetical protein